MTAQKFIADHDYPCWCDTSTARRVCQQLFGKRPFVVLECTHCGTHRLLPRVLAEAASAEILYNTCAAGNPAPEDEQNVINHMQHRFRDVALQFSSRQRVLDVGCGNGLVLDGICRIHGCTGKGVDVDRRRIATAKERRKHAEFTCELFDANNIRERFDVVVSNAVIEHVVDPVLFLQNIARAIQDDGSIFISTPNALSLNYRILGSWWRELLSVGEHIYIFSPQSLSLCAERAGLEVINHASDYDLAHPRLAGRGTRILLLSLWAIYREVVKRVSKKLSNRFTGDILYAHLKRRGRAE